MRYDVSAKSRPFVANSPLLLTALGGVTSSSNKPSFAWVHVSNAHRYFSGTFVFDSTIKGARPERALAPSIVPTPLAAT